MFVGHWTVTWTLIPFGWYIGKITGTLRLGLILEYLTGRAFYVALHKCLVYRSFPDTDCLKYFRDVGNNCVLDLNAGGTYTRVRPPECGLETVAQMPPFQHCQVAEVPSDTVAQVRGCMRMRGCMGNGHSPGETQDAWEVDVSPGEMECAEDSAYIRPDSVVESPVYVWSVTGSLFFGSILRRVRGSDVDGAGWVLALLSSSVVEYNVVRNKVACGGPGGGRHYCINPAAGYVLGLALDCMTW